MPVSLKKRQEARKVLVIDVDGENLTIEYCPGNWTPRFMDALQNASDSDHIGTHVAQTILKVLKKWDLIGIDGKTIVPLDAETLFDDVDMEIITFVVEKIIEDKAVKKQIPSD